MPPKVSITATGVMPKSGGFGSAGSMVAPVAATVAASSAPLVTASAHAAPLATCKYGDQCHGCKGCKKGGKGGGSQVVQLASEVIDLKKELASMKTASASTDARLGKVETDVGTTKSDIATMLAMMQEDRSQRALPLPTARPAIMPPPSTRRSKSPPTKMKLVTSSPKGSFGQECGFMVPQLGSSNHTLKSSGSYTGQNGWADKAVAGGGAMVVSSSSILPSPSSLSRKGSLPSPSSLPESGRNIASMSGSGLVRCNDPDAFFQLLQVKGWTTMLTLLQGSNPSNHTLTAAVNACALSPNDEATTVAIACFDRARSVTAFEQSQRDAMRAAFDPENPAFRQFCIRMAEYCSKSPDKGIEYRRTKYPYAYLVQNDQHRKELIAALKDN